MGIQKTVILLKRLKMKFKQDISTIEVYGAEALFNKAFQETFLTDCDEEFFLEGGNLNSCSDANGCPIEFEEDGEIYTVSHLNITVGNVLVCVSNDLEDNETLHRVDGEGFTKII